MKDNKIIVVWFIPIFCLVAGIISFYYFSKQSSLILISLLAIICTIVCSIRTEFIRNLQRFSIDMTIELRKIVWPSRKETMQSTIAVIAMVFVMGLVFWGVDAILFRIFAFLIGNRGV